MSWVQNCGDSQLFEDFMYGGALPFLNRFVCSFHFNAPDFIDEENVSLGIRSDAVPNLHQFDYSSIKQEDENSLGNYLPTDQISLCIKDEPNGFNIISQDEIKSEIFFRDIKLDRCADIIQSSEKDSIQNDKTAIHDVFKIKWDNVVEPSDKTGAICLNTRNNKKSKQLKFRNETNAVRNAHRRAMETQEQRRERLYKNAIRAALRRSMETEQQQMLRKQKNALRAAYRRSHETEDEKAVRRMKDKMRSADRRKRETEIQAKIRKYNDAVRAAFRRNNESLEEKQQRRKYDVIRASKRRKEESAEQRQKRLKADRERAAKRRFLKKIEHHEVSSDLFHKSELTSYIDQLNINNTLNSSDECDLNYRNIECVNINESDNTIVTTNNYLTDIPSL